MINNSGNKISKIIAGIARYLENIPITLIVEPDSAACVMESIKSGKIEKIDIKKESLMGGMSCDEVSLVPWQILKNSVSYCVTVSDNYISKTVKFLANCEFGDVKIIGGECSTPGIISLIGLCNDVEIRKNINLNEDSNILLFGCEGDADEKLYKKLLNS